MHYAVAVFTEEGGKKLDELLEPYDENLDVPHYISKDSIIKSVRDEIDGYNKSVYSKYLKDPEKYKEEYKSNTYHLNYLINEFPQRLSWSDKECYAEGTKGYPKEDIMPDGSVLSRYNPNSKWDWYVIGGRFSGRIPLKSGEFCDSSHIKYVDIDHCDNKIYNDAIRFWELYIDEQKPLTEEDKELIKFILYSKEYYKERYTSKNDYASWCAGFGFYAALLPNGLWLEPGEMGWFASSATAEDDIAWRSKVKEVLREAKDKGWSITIVDCHI